MIALVSTCYSFTYFPMYFIFIIYVSYRILEIVQFFIYKIIYLCKKLG